MYTTYQKRYYSPPFSALAAVSVRRLAWAMGKKMPSAVDLMVSLLPSIVDTSKVCLSCKDNTKCQSCVFCRTITAEEKAALLAAL
jgi:recombinational DNA repair protein RecR